MKSSKVKSQSPKSGQLHSNPAGLRTRVQVQRSQSPKSGQLHSNEIYEAYFCDDCEKESQSPKSGQLHSNGL